MRFWSVVAVVCVVLGGAVGINCIPQPMRRLFGWQFGWPCVSIDALPALMLVMDESVTYDEHLMNMQQIWELGAMGAGTDWAKYEYDPRWRWLRLPNGHVIQFCTTALCLNTLAWLGVVVMGVSTWHVRCRMRRARLGYACCGECGYDLTGNVSGVCPECGTAIHRQTA